MRFQLARFPCPDLVRWGSLGFQRLRSASSPCLSIFFLLVCVASPGLAQQPVLQANTNLSTDGYFVLSWTSAASESTEFLLEESSLEDFSDATTVYAGPDRSRVVSGKPNGTYFYRLSLAAGSSAVAEVVAVEVRHHSMQKALSFFFLGLVVFGSILATVFIGSHDQGNSG